MLVLLLALLPLPTAGYCRARSRGVEFAASLLGALGLQDARSKG